MTVRGFMMKKSLLLLGIVMVLLTGCGGAKPYVNMNIEIESDDYATLQLIAFSKTPLFAEDFYADMSDYTKGCNDMIELGKMYTNSDTPSKLAKIPSEKPIFIHAVYKNNIMNSSVDFILTPEKNKQYVLEYVRLNDKYTLYQLEGSEKNNVPGSRIRNFNLSECQ